MYKVLIINKGTGKCVKELKAGSLRMALIIESGVHRNLSKQYKTEIAEVR